MTNMVDPDRDVPFVVSPVTCMYMYGKNDYFMFILECEESALLTY